MLVKISNHLQNLAHKSKAIKLQFFPSEKEKIFSERALTDPLLEEKHKKMKGLIHKYPKRVLIELTLNCASFCRFCTRRREVSDLKEGELSEKNIEDIISYLESQPKINEVIFSGGDPLTNQHLLTYALKRIVKIPQIKILRVHTRVPVSDPRLITPEIINVFTEINKEKPLYLSIHFEHPDELTPQTLKAVDDLRKTGALLLSQSVFLKDVNDSYPVLERLFTRLSESGIKPYYIYHCDLVKGAEHFIVPIEKEISIMTKLRKNLSGIAFPLHVIDAPQGSGKIPVPEKFWKFSPQNFKDFRQKKIQMY